MANKAISELPQAENVNNQDLFVLEQGGLAKKLTAETFITEQGIIDALAEALDGHGGIQSVTLQSLSGRVRTYLITFSDGSATTFQVLDGSTITNIQKTSTAGLVDTYTVYMSDGTTTFFQVRNGQDGSATWNQIDSKAGRLVSTKSGDPVSDIITDESIRTPLISVSEMGATSQNGTPTPSNPQTINGLSGYDTKVTFNGSETWVIDNKQFLYGGLTNSLINIADRPSDNANPTDGLISDSLPVKATNRAYLGDSGNCIAGNINGVISVHFDNIDTVASLQSYLAANPLTVWYRSTSFDASDNQYYAIGIGKPDGAYYGIGTSEKIAPLHEGDSLEFVNGVVTRNSAFIDADYLTALYNLNNSNVAISSTYEGSVYFFPQWYEGFKTANNANTPWQTNLTSWAGQIRAGYAYGENRCDSSYSIFAFQSKPSSVQEAIAGLSSLGFEALLPLANPITETVAITGDFTDISGTLTLSGGGEIIVEFATSINDDQLRQDNNLAYVESSSSASRAYAVNDLFVNRDGLLCKVTATVSSGGTLVEGTNYTILSGNGGLGAEVTSTLNGKEDAGWLTGMGFSRTDVSGGGNVTIKDYTIFLTKLISVSGANIQSLVNAHYKVTFYLRNSNGGSFSLSGNCAGNTYNLSSNSSGLVSGTYEGDVSANGTIYNGLVGGSVGSGSIFAATVLVKF